MLFLVNSLLSIELFSTGLTHISLASFFGIWANSTNPDQTPQNVASHQGLYCLPMPHKKVHDAEMDHCTFKQLHVSALKL